MEYICIDLKMNEDYHQYIKEFFGKWAPYYDFIAMLASNVRKKVVDIADAKEGANILDVCTGTGAQALAFGRKGFDVVGIDLSPEMLSVAKRKNKYKNVRFKIADATEIPFDDNSFDVSCISLALHDMPYDIRHKVLNEMKRVSQKVVVIDYHIPQNRIEKWFHVFFTSLYESKYYDDFAGRDLKEMLQQHNLTVINESCEIINFFKIFVCEVAKAEIVA